MKCFYRYAAPVLALLLITTSGTLVPEATAQSAWGSAPSDQQDERPQYESPQPDDPAGTGVPDWADSGASSSDFGSASGGMEFGPQANQNTPPPPFGGGDIPQAPVDGGLGLLMLAGAGYAARRLRKSADDDAPGTP